MIYSLTPFVEEARDLSYSCWYQDSTIRKSLFNKLRGEGYFKEAATVLSGMNFEASSRYVKLGVE